jgi:hypothetical protein
MSEADSIHSSRRENLIEHLFIGEVLRYLWCVGYQDADVLRAETDAGGYDVVIEANSVIRHIQLKSSAIDAKTTRQKVNVELWNKPSGCVIWIRFDGETISLGPYKWHGGPAGARLTALSNPDNLPRAKHTKGNAQGEKVERKNIRVLNGGDFENIQTIADLVERLFGIPSLKN